ncbi:FecR domain-containing protein [Agriterribacter sp.]|uniref:FecR family protein n=1 Tax=Agriterribacter sp. TaxID=2821509 RepID=UPI002B7B0D12|nr:FecR domain-containing protein [Agriterribacter sp.]HRO44754.1 FecR domain-containing protein [Agriterribacter sp.]HRQ16427.1 FecR domain-containing protein [Agriterribacter sp.]
MNNKPDYYKALLEGYINDDISRAAAEELFKYIADHAEEAAVFIGPDDRLRFEEKINGDFRLENTVSKRMHERLLRDIKVQDERVNDDAKHSTPVRRLLKAKWHWAAAAVVLLVAGIYYMHVNELKPHSPAVRPVVRSADIEPPQLSQAMITLANGQKIALQNADEGTLAEQGNVQVIKLANGEIAYQPSPGTKAGSVAYNTLSNPRGSRVIRMTLSDGSGIWLNAGSSVTYPVMFTGSERKVSVTGEVYFEVAHHGTMPFIVNKGETNITVLGTRFNVNTYDDEKDIKVTLLEGSVKVDIPGAERLLKPGQQARIDHNLQVIDNANLEEVMAWKNGLFIFDNADIRTIMRIVARWYDLEVIYEGKMSVDRFQGKISMDTRLSELLEVLELNKVKYSIENKTIKIKSVN